MLTRSLLLSLLILTLGNARADENLSRSLENPKTREAALSLARDTLRQFFRNGKPITQPSNLPTVFKSRAGIIVTIEKKGRVAPRGCRGTLQPVYKNLAEEIIHNALAAATRDAREEKLRESELAECRISLTIILSLKPIQSLSQHDATRCGLIAKNGTRIGLVLPYEGKDSATQWEWARRKAGLAADEKAEMLEVEAVRFKEK